MALPRQTRTLLFIKNRKIHLLTITEKNKKNKNHLSLSCANRSSTLKKNEKQVSHPTSQGKASKNIYLLRDDSQEKAAKHERQEKRTRRKHRSCSPSTLCLGHPPSALSSSETTPRSPITRIKTPSSYLLFAIIVKSLNR